LIINDPGQTERAIFAGWFIFYDIELGIGIKKKNPQKSQKKLYSLEVSVPIGTDICILIELITGIAHL